MSNKLAICIFFLAFLLTGDCIANEEKILSYKTSIKINQDRSIEVREDITVVAYNNKIKRGITRGLPLYRKINGEKVKVRYKIGRILKDGIDELYHTSKEGDNLVIYIGSKDVFLAPGSTYKYTIEYRVPDQINFSENSDDFYWNVIGNNLIFEVEKAHCLIQVPNSAKIFNQSCFTGYMGFANLDCTIEQNNNMLLVETKKSLAPREGLTIKFEFQKGVFHPKGFLEENWFSIFFPMCLFPFFFYFYSTWKKHGVDPPTPPSKIEFYPPDNLSPASIGYIYQEAYHPIHFIATIINLAVNKYITIKRFRGKIDGFDTYTLKKTQKKNQDILEEENAIMDSFFSKSNTIELNGYYNQKVERASTRFQYAMKSKYDDLIKEGKNYDFIYIPLAAMAFLFGGVLLYHDLFLTNSFEEIVFIVCGIVGALSLLLYFYLIERPSEKKLALITKINGFKEFINMSKEEQLYLTNSPSRTSEYFEQLLPYAHVFGAGEHWNKVFEDTLNNSLYKIDWSEEPDNYDPLFDDDLFFDDFVKNFKTSSSLEPIPFYDSSGGFGGDFSGGGSSGGGGGGGSVGGW